MKDSSKIFNSTLTYLQKYFRDKNLKPNTKNVFKNIKDFQVLILMSKNDMKLESFIFVAF